jgi:hypothetical protein
LILHSSALGVLPSKKLKSEIGQNKHPSKIYKQENKSLIARKNAAIFGECATKVENSFSTL